MCDALLSYRLPREAILTHRWYKSDLIIFGHLSHGSSNSELLLLTSIHVCKDVLFNNMFLKKYLSGRFLL